MGVGLVHSPLSQEQGSSRGSGTPPQTVGLGLPSQLGAATFTHRVLLFKAVTVLATSRFQS